MGDLNFNFNGRRLLDFLGGSELIRALGNGDPTHILEGRLDYACLFCDVHRSSSLETVSSLLSDRFAILARINLVQSSSKAGRKRLELPEDKRDDFINQMSDWFDEYNLSDNVDSFVNDMCNAVETELDVRTKHKNKKKKEERTYGYEK